ncbi:MAG: acetylglutamate kinase [Caldilineales bacterium]|nr:acetylglutamate kinase [Caldilineales bacterium]MCW5860940.1 acetylglutamate kinase [Caldilineales bacterium]
MNNKPIHMIKIGGNQLDDREFLAGFVETVQAIQEKNIRPVIVHGGGQEIVRLHDELGVPFDTVQGLRVTTEQSLRLVKMALNGIANLRVVRWLVNGGVEAIGLNGVDLGLVRVEKYELEGVDLGRVGKVVRVQAEKLTPLLEAGLVPVISPISLGLDGLSYNVNADHVAEAVAIALKASSLVFITNVPGVLVAGRPMRVLASDQIEDLIFGHFITGGMIPKVRAAAEAVAHGLPNTLITDLTAYAQGEGTFIVQHS